MSHIKKLRWEPASPGLNSYGKPLRIRLKRCVIDRNAPQPMRTEPRDFVTNIK